MTSRLGVSTGAKVELAASQRAAIEWLRASVDALDVMPFPGSGSTAARWSTLVDLGANDLARARLAEGHLDAQAILAELGARRPLPGLAWGVWAAEPTRLQAEPRAGGWHLSGEKGWCSGAHGLDRALVTATAPDGPRLFVVDPEQLEPVAGSWPAIGMAATASLTMRFDTSVDAHAAVGGPGAYVERPGFWHGGAGVATVWFGGALGVAERLRVAVNAGDDRLVDAAFGRVRSRLEAAAALIGRSASEIDARPLDVDAARQRAMRLRLVVEDVARSTIAEATTALGAGPLAHEPDHARRVVDLELYLRQLKPAAAAADFGASHAAERITW
jgi:alkylation response protein AidB-like acyl-CoA dehydrogenase